MSLISKLVKWIPSPKNLICNLGDSIPVVVVSIYLRLPRLEKPRDTIKKLRRRVAVGKL